MKTNMLILGGVVTALAVTAFATEPLLSPRAAGNQIKIISAATTAANPAALCQARMGSSPKVVAECASHPGAAMSCCGMASAQ